MSVFFTSDTHFGHKNIIEYCDRPWRTPDGHPDTAAMERAMVARWNSVVGPQDTVYHLGDFGFATPAKLREVRAKLNGKIILIKGNHDKKVNKWLALGDEVYPSMMLGKTFLVHVPPIPGDGRYPLPIVPAGAKLVLCGHVHDEWQGATMEHEGQILHLINVGVDVWNYTPQTPQQLGFDPKLIEEN